MKLIILLCGLSFNILIISAEKQIVHVGLTKCDQAKLAKIVGAESAFYKSCMDNDDNHIKKRLETLENKVKEVKKYLGTQSSCKLSEDSESEEVSDDEIHQPAELKKSDEKFRDCKKEIDRLPVNYTDLSAHLDKLAQEVDEAKDTTFERATRVIKKTIYN